MRDLICVRVSRCKGLAPRREVGKSLRFVPLDVGLHRREIAQKAGVEPCTFCAVFGWVLESWLPLLTRGRRFHDLGHPSGEE